LIPSYEAIMRPLLEEVADGQDHGLADLRSSLGQRFSLTPDELAELLPSGRTSVFYSRVHWAKTYLTKAGTLSQPRRGVVRITSRGRELVQERVDVNTALLTDRFEEMRAFRALSRAGRGRRTPGHVDEKVTPLEAITSGYQRLRAATEADILERAKAMPADRFEDLVVALLLRLGYGGTHGDGAPLGRSGDGGVDGVIRQDKLGLELIYVQAKRWLGTVSSSVVREFAGSIAAKRAHKGVILTTAAFSKDALADAERMSDRIVLVDGPRLAELMFDVGLGVSTDATYEVKRIDSDYFEPPD
jgi:restriction system protein